MTMTFTLTLRDLKCIPDLRHSEDQGFDFIDVLLATIMRADPQRIINIDNFLLIVARMGFACVKAALKMLLKSTPDLFF
jgi:hypothetical protein